MNIKYFVSYKYSVKDILFGFIPIGRRYSEGHSEVILKKDLSKIRELIEALIKEYEDLGAVNPSFVIINYKKIAVIDCCDMSEDAEGEEKGR